jgi:arylsulfatase A-like enzyme
MKIIDRIISILPNHGVYPWFYITMLLVLLFSMGCSNPEDSKPNILLIVSDDQGWGDLSLNGNTNLATPNIDNLAETGVTFDRFYVSPVCSPTRAEMLTGRYHVRGGVYSTSAGGERLDLDETTLAEVFKEAGYATAAYGKWHNGMQPPYHPNARGFDDFYGFCSGHWGNYFGPMLEHNGKIVDGKGYIVDDLTDHALEFIDQNKDNPFFLYLPYNTPHSPMQVPDQWWNEFRNRDLNLRHRDPDMEDIPFTRAALAMCENIDWNIGRILARLGELNLFENTIIVYFSDNGPNSWRWNGGMKGRKGSTDEGGVRSPLIIKWDGKFREGLFIKEISAVTDIFPTLTDLAGINFNPAKPLDGISLMSLLLEENKDWPERFIINHWNNRTSVRSQRYRLDHEGQLFDMMQDPGQYQDISEEMPEILDYLVDFKRQWEQEVLSELQETDTRPFTLGHPDFIYNQLPARDGTGHGNIERSNQYPNCSYFTNWTSIQDKITWEVEVIAEGDFEVEIYYTCPEQETGSVFQLRFGDETLDGKITEAHDPPLIGLDQDRVPRIESYVKDFKPLKIGTIHLDQGNGVLELKATAIPGSRVMDFRLLMLKRIPDQNAL